MAKDRVNPNFGPFYLTFTGTTAATQVSPWVRLGPFLANRSNLRATFANTTASTSAKQVQIEGLWSGQPVPDLSTGTTLAGVVLATRTSTQTAAIASTNALLYNTVRARSTALPNTVVATVHFGALA